MKKIIIIGAGIAGLTAGIAAQKNGFDTEILEMHYLPGGLCTSWKRRDYIFDGCIRYVYGSGADKFCSSVMQGIGVDKLQYIHHNESIHIETSTGQNVIFYCDLPKLEKHLLEISPEDLEPIKALIKSAKAISRTVMPAISPATIKEVWKNVSSMFRFIPVVVKNGKATLGSFASSLKSAALREAFSKYYGYADLDMLPLLFLIIDMAQHHIKNAGWPVGGSLRFARELEKNYLALGGSIRYNAKALKILTEDGAARGVRISGGEELSADAVISAGDAHTALYDMLDGKYIMPEWQKAYADEKTITPVLQISLGISEDLSDIPHSLAFSLKEPLCIAGVTYDYLSLRHYCYDETMAPKGKSVLTVVLETDFDYWVQLSHDNEGYRAEKDAIAIAEQVIRLLDNRFPGLRDKAEVIDVATPVTYVRYTGNYRGSPQGWQTAIGHMGNFPGKLPGLERFYMIGQWVQRGGGLPGGAISAYNTVKKICKEFGMAFR